MEADKLPFRSQAAAMASAPGPEGAIEPFREVVKDPAPAGLWPDKDLPVRDVGSPASYGGYSPDPGQPPLPPPGSTEGDGLPPSGDRR